MSEVFLKILNMSISAGWLVLAVAVIRVVLRRAPKWIRGILWAFVGLRLVFPVSLQSILSLIPSGETVPTEILQSQTPQIYSGIPVVNHVVNPIITESFAPTSEVSTNPMQAAVNIAALVWVSGILAMLVYTFVSYVKIRLKVKESVVLRDNIYICDRVSSPFILGIVRPRIYMPSAMNEADSNYILSHERAHLARHDNIWKPLGFLLLSVYWFNPVLWIGYVLLCRDIELACDEKVIGVLGSESKREYSTSLVNCSIPRRLISACPLAFGEVGVKERVKNVLCYKKPTLWVIIASVIAVTVTAVCFLTDPVSKDESGASVIYNVSDDSVCYDEFGLMMNIEILDGNRFDIVFLHDPRYATVGGEITTSCAYELYYHETTVSGDEGWSTPVEFQEYMRGQGTPVNEPIWNLLLYEIGEGETRIGHEMAYVNELESLPQGRYTLVKTVTVTDESGVKRQTDYSVDFVADYLNKYFIPSDAKFPKEYEKWHDSILFDADNDGREEICRLHYGSFDGKKAYTLSISENGREEYYNRFTTVEENCDLSFVKQDGKLKIKGIADGERETIYLFDISFDDGNVHLTQDGHPMSEHFTYVGDQGIGAVDKWYYTQNAAVNTGEIKENVHESIFFDKYGLKMDIVFREGHKFEIVFTHRSDYATMNGTFKAKDGYELYRINGEGTVAKPAGEFLREEGCIVIDSEQLSEEHEITHDGKTVISQEMLYTDTVEKLPPGEYYIEKKVTIAPASRVGREFSYFASFSVDNDGNYSIIGDFNTPNMFWYDSVTFDIDGDGNAEICRLIKNFTSSSVFTQSFGFSVSEKGSPEYFTSFGLGGNCYVSFVLLDGELAVKRTSIGEPSKETVFAVSLEGEDIVLRDISSSENGELSTKRPHGIEYFNKIY